MIGAETPRGVGQTMVESRSLWARPAARLAVHQAHAGLGRGHGGGHHGGGHHGGGHRGGGRYLPSVGYGYPIVDYYSDCLPLVDATGTFVQTVCPGDPRYPIAVARMSLAGPAAPPQGPGAGGRRMMHAGQLTHPAQRRPSPMPRWGVSGPPPGGPVELTNADVMRDVKTLMTLVDPSLASSLAAKGQDTFNAWLYEPRWTAENWSEYQAILAKLPKSDAVAYGSPAAIGTPPKGTLGYPSAVGIALMGNALIQSGVFTSDTLDAALPTLGAYKGVSAGETATGKPGVMAPMMAPGVTTTQASAGGTSPWVWALGGVALIAVAAIALRKK